MQPLKLFLFGTPRCERAGQPVEFSLRKATAVFVFLAVTGKTHSRDSLAAMFWPENDQSTARSNLRRVIYWINKYLGSGFLLAQPEEVSLNPELDLWIDTRSFEEAIRACQDRNGGDCQFRMERLAEATALYTDGFLKGFTLGDAPAFDEWQFYEEERLRQAYAWALEQLIQLHQDRQEYQQAIEYARRWLALDSLHEPAQRALMQLYALSDQYSAALRQYETCRRLLQDELGVEPEEETKALFERIRRREIGEGPDGKRPEPVYAAQPQTPRHNLLKPITPLLGRDQELGEITSLLSKPELRLLTITGPGGIGKTRLAQEVAWFFVEGENPIFRDGVFFVSLASLNKSSALPQAMAQALDFNFHKDAESPRKQILNYLRPKKLLLVLDNFEHLLEEADAQPVVELLEAAPEVKILVTSLIRLSIQSEQLYPLSGLHLPAIGEVDGEMEVTGGLLLFQESARRAQPGFEVTKENAAMVARICGLVAGSPLGIQLAGSWAGMLSLREIALEIEKSLDFLESGWQDLPERHRSLRAVFEASWKLLDEEERKALCRLAVFRSGFTRQAAGEIAGTHLKTLQSLANKSWLERGASGRWQIHELLRLYAEEKLNEDPAAQENTLQRLGDYYTLFSEIAGEAIKGTGQKEAFDNLEAEFENIQTAWLYLLEERRFGDALNMLYSLVRYSMARVRADEIWAWLETALVAAAQEQNNAGSQDTHGKALICAIFAMQGWLRFDYHHGPLGGQFAEDKERIIRAMEMVNDFDAEHEMEIWYPILMVQYAWYIDRESGIEKLRKLLEQKRPKRDEWTTAFILKSLGDLLHSLHAHEESKSLLLEALEIYRRLGDYLAWGSTLRVLGAIAKEQQVYAEARAFLEEARQISMQAGDGANLGQVLWELGHISRNEARFEEAFALFEEQRRVAAQSGLHYLEAQALSTYSIEAIRYGDLGPAREARQESLKISETIDDPNGISWSYWEMGELFRVEGDPDEARRWYQKSLALFEEHRINLGLAYYERGLGDLALLEGNYGEARERFDKYLSLAEAERNTWSAAYAFAGLGQAYLGLEEIDEGRRYFQRAVQLAHDMGNPGLILKAAAGLAELRLVEGEAAGAIKLCAFVLAQPAAWKETRAQAQKILEKAGANMPPEEKNAALEAGKAARLAEISRESG